MRIALSVAVVALACMAGSGAAKAEPVWLDCALFDVKRSGLAGVFKDGRVRVRIDEAAKTAELVAFPDFMRTPPQGLDRAITSVKEGSVFVAYKGPLARPEAYGEGAFFAVIVSVLRAEGELTLKAGPYRPVSRSEPNKWGPATHDLDEMSQASGRCAGRRHAL
ncbi:hypothetical protein [Azospirillum sp.]|uniref:hypothetical protein n=1 Tax=Azospirillum sp. TaxID=34012 RepID=UPI003D7442BC